jgi:hypothetical protein
MNYQIKLQKKYKSTTHRENHMKVGQGRKWKKRPPDGNEKGPPRTEMGKETRDGKTIFVLVRFVKTS